MMRFFIQLPYFAYHTFNCLGHLMTLPSSPQHDASLEQALAKSQMQQKRLNQITIVMAVIMASFISLIAANHNLYSIAATFVAALIFLIAASVYRRSMLILTPFIVVYCLADNFLSHQMQYHRASFGLQLAAMIIFTMVFYLSRPYLFNIFKALDKEQ